VPYLSASAVVIHYEEALYQVYAPLPLPQRKGAQAFPNFGITFYLCLHTFIVYRGIHGTAPRYLSDLLHRVSDITSHRRLRSSTSSELVIPLSRLVTVGDRSFAVAGPRLWDTLPEDITSAPSLLMFRRKLKTHLFGQSYPDIIV